MRKAERKDIQISVLTANFVGILLTLPFVAIIVAGYILRNGMFDFHKVLDENPVLYFAGIGGIIAASIVL
ncbi:MAG: hypothetical protein V3G41_10140, partial [Lachnospiraceae bacterium]